MTLQERIALSLAGYKRKDIDAFEKEEAQRLEKEAEPKAETKAETEEVKEEAKAEPKAETEEVVDYKALYEESQKTLAQAQKANINQNLGEGAQSDEDIVKDLVSSFM